MFSKKRLNTWKIYLTLTGLGIFLILLNNHNIKNYQVTIVRNSVLRTFAKIYDHEGEKKVGGKSKFLVNTGGCQIEGPDDIITITRDFVRTAESIQCDWGSQLPLTEANETHVFVNSAAIQYYYNHTDTPNCHWRKMEREPNDDYRIKIYDDRQFFRDSSRVTEEFIKVECFSGNHSVYRDYHFFIRRKPSVEERCRLNFQGSKLDTKLSILILGLDTVSRMHLHRSMPKTVKALEDLGAVELLGYNKLGDNTLPNVVPLLTGLSHAEFERIFGIDANYSCRNCPFIWSNFSAAGYRTVWAEDSCLIPTFSTEPPGFPEQPTDYYYRPFCLAIEADIGNTVAAYTNLCVGTRRNFENLLSYSRRAAEEFSDDPYFAFIWESSLTHGSMDYVALGDDVYERTIRDLYQSQLMNSTLLMVVSDHGMRWGEYRQTHWGRVEDNLPLAFLVFPEWWRKMYPTAFANLRGNAARLTTPFDLHETIADILRMDYAKESIEERTEALNVLDDEDLLPRGISLFLPIPERRSCTLAEIPGHWCACHTLSDISVSGHLLGLSANYLVQQLNFITRSYPQCNSLSLRRVISGRVWTPSEENDCLFPWIRYLLTIEAAPGGAVFEALIKHYYNGTDELEGSIARLNRYGNQSSCVKDYRIRPYCICVPTVG